MCTSECPLAEENKHCISPSCPLKYKVTQGKLSNTPHVKSLFQNTSEWLEKHVRQQEARQKNMAEINVAKSFHHELFLQGFLGLWCLFHCTATRLSKLLTIHWDAHSTVSIIYSLQIHALIILSIRIKRINKLFIRNWRPLPKATPANSVNRIPAFTVLLTLYIMLILPCTSLKLGYLCILSYCQLL